MRWKENISAAAQLIEANDYKWKCHPNVGTYAPFRSPHFLCQSKVAAKDQRARHRRHMVGTTVRNGHSSCISMVVWMEWFHIDTMLIHALPLTEPFRTTRWKSHRTTLACASCVYAFHMLACCVHEHDGRHSSKPDLTTTTLHYLKPNHFKNQHLLSSHNFSVEQKQTKITQSINNNQILP